MQGVDSVGHEAARAARRVGGGGGLEGEGESGEGGKHVNTGQKPRCPSSSGKSKCVSESPPLGFQNDLSSSVRQKNRASVFLSFYRLF